MAELDILVVDDEPLIADYLTRILALRGYSARSFTNPHDALAAIQHGCPRLLITDLRMPGLSGVELAIRIRAPLGTARHGHNSSRRKASPLGQELALAAIRSFREEQHSLRLVPASAFCTSGMSSY